MRTITIFAILCISCIGFLSAEIAPLLQYQGRLTDANGAPLADGTYSVTFGIYASSGAPSPIWTSGAQEVAVAGGLFTYILGSNVSLPSNIFDNQTRYLGITIGNDVELTPRTQFTASPYAYRALKADSADVLTNPDEYVRADSGVLTGTLHFDSDKDGQDEGSIVIGGFYSRLYLNHFDRETVTLLGDGYGFIILRNGDDGNYRVALSARDEGGRLRLADSLGVSRVELRAYEEGGIFNLSDSTDNKVIRVDAGATGDLSVILPDRAINSDEIADEPGIAAVVHNDYVSITSPSDLDEIERFLLYIPVPGYLKITARYFLRLGGTTGINGAFIQVDTLSGGSLTFPHYNFHYHSAFPSTGDHYEPAAFSTLFYFNESGSGVRYFYLNGRLASGATGTAEIGRIQIIAEFYPTSYGGVKSLTNDPTGFDNTTTVTITDDDGNTSTMYEVDLRELEIKAKDKRIAAQKAYIEQLEAEQELERARHELE
ncbi:MAG: hypothetical protein R3F48_00785 [Candidatus Zixiibacteriota bacterium]